jgi:hypothetical protein
MIENFIPGPYSGTGLEVGVCTTCKYVDNDVKEEPCKSCLDNELNVNINWERMDVNT